MNSYAILEIENRFQGYAPPIRFPLRLLTRLQGYAPYLQKQFRQYINQGAAPQNLHMPCVRICCDCRATPLF
jgi:hypothetical protein